MGQMPVKTRKHQTKKYPKHYAKVYWPYLPLVLIVILGLWFGQPLVNRSQRAVLSYSTNVNANALVDATNKQRASANVKALTLNADLAKAAQNKANDMVTRNYWSHQTPDGQSPWVFIDQAGFQYSRAGENLAYGFMSSDEIISGWMNSSPHRANMLDPDYSEVGFGIANSENYQQSGPETVIVAFYAKPGTSNSHATVTPSPTANTTNTQPPAEHHDEELSINKAQALTKGRMPWITFIAGLVIGGGLIYLIVKHSLGLSRVLRKGEKFVVAHPLIDITLVALIALCALLLQTVGKIR